MTVSAFWMPSDNVGDHFGPYMVRKLTGALPLWGKPDDVQFVLNGSILNHCGAGKTAWGCGLASMKDEVNPNAKILAVRGPLTRAIAQASGCVVPAIYGDAALIAPRLYQPKGPKLYKLGIIPHYTDQLRAWAWYQHHESAAKLNGVRMISVFLGVEEFIREIAACDYVLSSSLHGLVFASAYQVDAAWVKIGDGIGGDSTKFRDHLQTMGVEPYEPLDLRSGWPTPAELFRFRPPQPSKPFDDSALWDAMPPELKP